MLEARRLEVAKQIVAAQRQFKLFEYNGEQRPSGAILRAMQQSERAFADEDYDRTEHLAKVVILMAKRDAPKFAADPKRYVERQELRT